MSIFILTLSISHSLRNNTWPSVVAWLLPLLWESCYSFSELVYLLGFIFHSFYQGFAHVYQLRKPKIKKRKEKKKIDNSTLNILLLGNGREKQLGGFRDC